jgi:HK97 gp10 family phage protein
VAIDGVTVNEDNTEEASQGIQRAIDRALEEIGLAAEGYAKRACPVDTGRLRNSITHVVEGSEDAVYVGTDVEYAPYVELGTRRTAAQPFLRPAATGHGPTYRSILERNLEEG